MGTQEKIIGRSCRLLVRMAASLLAVAAVGPAAAQSRVPLGAYNVDPSQVSVSGFAAGGSMAIQLGVAYSSRIMGVAAFDGIPYDCRRPGNVTLADCEDGLRTPSIESLALNMNRWSGKEIDPVSNLNRQKIFVYVGKYDSTVSATVVGQTVALYRQFVSAENIRYEATTEANHVFPTDFDNPLAASNTAWTCAALRGVIANCGYDGALAALQWIYGPLNPRAAQPGGDLIRVDQGFFGSRASGMDEIAFLYVPKSCQAGMTCRLHIFLHDENQSYFSRQDTFIVDYSGYTRWADTNGIVLLFPQTYPDPNVNPTGFWDLYGRYDDQFDQKGGAQMSAIMAMVARITSGYRGLKAVEFHHAGFDHYFVSSDADEIDKLDTGFFAGWARTGESFGVLPVDPAGAGNVCRFFSTSFGAKSSHFYTADAGECETVKRNPDWQFEGLRFRSTCRMRQATARRDRSPCTGCTTTGRGMRPTTATSRVSPSRPRC